MKSPVCKTGKQPKLLMLCWSCAIVNVNTGQVYWENTDDWE